MKKNVHVSLLTSCTVTRNFEPVIRIADAPIAQTMDELCAWWVEQMRTVTKNSPDVLKTPGELYAGMSFTAITEVAQDIGHDNIFIVTGGVGLSRHTTKIVPYDFTSDKKAEHNALQHVVGEKFIPHVWWEKINGELHNSLHPVKRLLDKCDVIVGALPKAFIKYVISDLMQIDPEDLRTRVFIPIPKSMIGSVPKALHEAFVPYDADYLSDVQYTRVDKPQRVAQKFIRCFDTAEEAVQLADKIRDLAVQASSKQHEELDYDTLFKTFPTLAKTSTITQALAEARVLGVEIGGKHKFAGAWRAQQGRVEVQPTEDERKRAAKALAQLMETAKPREYADEEETLKKLGLFVEMLRESNNETFVFTAADVAKWGKLAYPKDPVISNSNKIVHILSYNAEYLGLIKFKANSKVVYRIAE